MKLKLDEQGHAVLVDGKPVYVYDDNREIPFDAPGTVATITRLNGEAKSHREAKEKLEGIVKGFEGLDAEAARKALETVANLDSKSLVAAGEVEKIKAEAHKAYEEQIKAVKAQYEPVIAERDAIHAKLIDQTVGNAFSGSKFIADKLVVPAPMVKATFGAAFKVENDTLVGYDPSGNKIFSRERPGEVAGFDEALGLLVEASPYRDSILKGSGAHGSGAPGGGNVFGKSLNRAAFDALPPTKQMEHVKSGGSVTD